MSNIIDISARITNQLPVVKITDDIVVTVNNRKSVVLSIQAMAEETQRKSKNKADSAYDQMSFMTKAMGMLIGEKNTAAIEELDLPMPEYSALYESIMNVATGSYKEEGTPSK